MPTTRNHSIDVAKGGLILFVVLGHAIQGTIEGNLARFYIYSFHMPLFLFISGYLLSVPKLQQQSLSRMLGHYGRRMLGWWGLAWLIYTPIAMRDDLSWHSLVSYIIDPYYHLWYVPTLFFFVLVVYFLCKACRNERVIYGTLIVLAVAIFVANMLIHPTIPGLFNYGFLPYFVLGLCARNIPQVRELRLFNGGGNLDPLLLGRTPTILLP